ncbi:Uncharacterized protein TCM_020240 [Theobroma cacao]|uniref:Uncharacterized protein n=1 Tax=Theobroma cacao TaxID=3641 RepID=A0A061EKL8_THECC|nr:Uncharacterized protein TCM_020240 [Theobroma cacao]
MSARASTQTGRTGAQGNGAQQSRQTGVQLGGANCPGSLPGARETLANPRPAGQPLSAVGNRTRGTSGGLRRVQNSP